MAVNTNAEHSLKVVDDSGISSVGVCSCGRSWVGVGDERCRLVRYEHALHVFDAGGALVGNSGRLRVEPIWGEMPNYPTPEKGRPIGGPSGAERRDQVRLLLAEGKTPSEIAIALQLGLRWTQKMLSVISQEDLVA